MHGDLHSDHDGKFDSTFDVNFVREFDGKLDAVETDWLEWAAWALPLGKELSDIADRQKREQRFIKLLAHGFVARATLTVGPRSAERDRAIPLHSRLRIRSALKIPSNLISEIVLQRPKKSSPFSELDLQRLVILHKTFAWVHDEAKPAPRGRVTSLSPREREAMQYFVDGRTEKEVAASLGRSRHTVHAYVKRIYRTLGVRSRAELRAALKTLDSASTQTTASKPEQRVFTSRPGA